MTTPTKPKPELTSTDVLESLTGFDELAIAQAFGKPLEELINTTSMFGRALVFALKRREGMKDPEARKHVMELRIGEIDAHFKPDPENDGELPGSEGKDGDD